MLGFAAALAVSRVMASVLFGVSPLDPVGLVGGAALVLGVAITVSVLAARLALKAEPGTTLRRD